MLPQEVIDKIREIELAIYGQDFRLYMDQQPLEVRQEFYIARAELTNKRIQLETASITIIANKLAAESENLKRSIKQFEQTITAISNAQNIVNILSTIVSIIIIITTF